MFGPALIIFRETLEAVLVISIVGAATRGVSRRSWFIGAGVLVGLVGSAILAGLTESIADLAGLAGQMARFLIQADWLPPLVTPLWDTSFLLSGDSLAGRILHALVGYEPNPSGMQMLFYAGALGLILFFAELVKRRQTAQLSPVVSVPQT